MPSHTCTLPVAAADGAPDLVLFMAISPERPDIVDQEGPARGTR